MMDVNKIAEALNGSCETLSDVLNDYGFSIDDFTQFEELDAITMQCNTCGWWYDTDDVSNINDDMVCNDCRDS